jgi:hypothetical protein
MKNILFCAAGALLFQLALSGAAHAQLARVNGNVSQTSSISEIAAIALGPGSHATIHSSTVLEGATVNGSVTETSSGGLRLALAAGPGSRASIAESTICGNVSGDARLHSYIGTAASVSLLPAGGTRISSASAGPGSQGSVRSLVSVGTVVAVDFIPWADSRIILGSTRGGC